MAVCLVCLYQIRDIKPWNHLHMCTVPHVSMWWIAAGEKTGKRGKPWCDRRDAQVLARATERECFYRPEKCEIVCRCGFANVNIVFLICLMFIFERSIQMALFRIHLVSVIKCVTCQVRFWINNWRASMDKQRQHSLRSTLVLSVSRLSRGLSTSNSTVTSTNTKCWLLGSLGSVQRCPLL